MQNLHFKWYCFSCFRTDINTEKYGGLLCERGSDPALPNNVEHNVMVTDRD